MAISAIYKITSPSGKVYIGSAVNYSNRRSNHLSDLRNARHANKKLQNAWNKYGDALVFSIIEVVPVLEDLLAREQHWIDFHDAFVKGYNMCPTAGSALGRKHSDETIRKLKEINSTPEFRAAHSARHKGKIVSDDTRAKQAAAKTGIIKTKEVRDKMKATHQDFWSSPASQERRKKLSDAAKKQWERQRVDKH